MLSEMKAEKDSSFIKSETIPHNPLICSLKKIVLNTSIKNSISEWDRT